MPKITPAFPPDLVCTMRWALDAASDRVPAKSRTPATKAKMAQRIVSAAQEGITDAEQLVEVAVAECPRSNSKPAASAAPATAYQSQDQQKHHGSNERVDNQRNDAYSEVNTKLGQQPVAYEGTNETDEQVTDQPKATAVHHLPCEPTCDNSDENDYEQTLTG